MMSDNREKIYDEQIAPLMTEIIKIAKQHDIPMVASFQLDDVDLLCSTVIVPEGALPTMYRLANIINGGGCSILAVTVVRKEDT
jgi:hypothetical protein